MDTEVKSLWQKLFQKLSTMKSDGKILNVAGEEINPATTENIEALTQEVTIQGDNIVQEVNTQGESIITAVQNSGGTTLKAFSNIMVRPVGGGTNVYAAGDVVGQLLTISNVAKSDGTGVRISRVRLQTNDTGVAGKKFNIHIYRDVPTIASDNAPFTIDWSNHLKRVGVFPIVLGVGNSGTVGMNDYNEITLNPLAKDVYFVIETVDGFTPSASSTEFQVTIDCELSNN